MTDRRPKSGLSHVEGSTDAPLIEATISQALAETVSRFPDREAAVFVAENIRWTYVQFSSEVDRLASGLLKLGVKAGDRVGIWSPNRSEWLLTQFATARIGAILVCINPAYRKHELVYALNAVGCTALVTARSFKTSNYLSMLKDCAANLPHLKHIIAVGDEKQDGLLTINDVVKEGDSISADELDAITDSLSNTDPINIQFTSGTTGSPKGACLTHRNIVNNAANVTAKMRLSETDRLCIPVPFYHCFGMVMGTLGCVTKGAAMIIPGEGFDPAETLQAISSEACTALYGVPTMFVAELGLSDFETYDLSQLRTGIMAGASCPIEVMKQVQSKMNMSEVTIAYGMTETSPVSFQSDVDDPLDKRVSTVGRVHPNVECKIVGPDGNTLPIGEKGELLTRGYSVMTGYWGDEQRTNEAIRDGWMHTGDLAVIDDEGYCDITGRVKDMIIRGGENIYPREVEEFLFTHQGIEQVQVFGIPDEKFGEIVCAWVVASDPSLTPNDVRAYCEDQIAHFKIPKHIVMKEGLPMTVTGKPQKFVMQEEMIKALKLNAFAA